METITKEQIQQSSPYIWPGVNRSKQPLHEFIIQLVCKSFNITLTKLHQKTRERQFTTARHMAQYMIYKHCEGYGCVKLSVLFSQHHTTVMFGLKSIQGLMDTDAALKCIADEIELQIKRQATLTNKAA